MNGWDFSILWMAGRAILEGQSPYGVPNFFYPPSFAYLLTIPALLPQQVAFALWLLVNLSLLIYFFRRKFWQWLFYVPVLHLFSSGQVELLWWSMERGINRTWRGALLGALITLKPQTAILLLPWHLLDWLRHDRRMLLRWVALTMIVWGVPLLWTSNWYSSWLNGLSTGAGFLVSASNSPGIFSLLRLSFSLWPVLALIAVGVFVWGQFQSREIARSSASIAAPVGLFYSTLALLSTAPAVLLVPLSLLVAVLTIILQTFIPFLALPVAVLVWQLRHHQPMLPEPGRNNPLEENPA